MNWFIVPRLRPRPKRGRYPDWKPAIAKNCRHQCVYCTISEGEYGGIDNFHVEHFRPKSRFKKLENDIDNLFVACAICNRFKSDEWPGNPRKRGNAATFLDPGMADYHQHMRLVGPSVFLEGKTVAGAFMVERLFLNREQLLISRRYRTALAILQAAIAYFDKELGKLAVKGAPGKALMLQVTKISFKLNQLQAQLATARPYKAGATQRARTKVRPAKRPKR